MFIHRFRQTISTFLAVIVLASFALPAAADQFDTKVNQLNNDIANAQNQIDALSHQADSLSKQIDLLNNQIDALEAQIELNNTKMAKLNASIADVKAQLAVQQDILGANIKMIYQTGDQSTLETLVSSGSLGDYFDSQEYQQRVQDKIQQAVDKINALKKSLDKQQADLATVIANQKAQQQALATAKQQQQDLLDQTNGQEANYQSLVSAKQQQLDAVYAERAALDTRNGVRVATGGSGGYPYANYVPDSGSDPWGFLYRECVSYVAWKRRATGHAPYPLYWGNAGDWAYAVPTTSTPSVGAVAVFAPGVQSAGWAGHVAYVESVNSNGTINISEYNWSPYNYDQRFGVSTSGLRFIR